MKIVDLDEAEMGNNVPTWHPFCRCTVVAYYEHEDENIIQSGGDGKIYPISDKTIDNLETPYIESLSKKENEKLNEYNKVLLKEARDNNESMEVAYKFNDFDGKVGKIYGSVTELDMGRYPSKYVLHNHPNNEPFSTKDLSYFFNNNKIKYMGMVKHNGEVEILIKRESYDLRKSIVEFKRSEIRYENKFANNEQKRYNKVVKDFLKNQRKQGLNT